MDSTFDDIAPLYDHEVNATIQELLIDPGFIHAVKYVLPNIDWDDFSNEMLKYKTKFDFQSKMISPFIWSIAKKTSTSVNSSGIEEIDQTKQYLYLSNHRDIVLDAGILNIIFNEKGLNTTEIAIGDNLLVFPWIKKLVRLNKSFIVQRGVSVRQMLEVSKKLSAYIHYAITRKKESIWLAQREGRAKDSDDRTQESLLKMLALAPENTPFIESLKELNIRPLSISYEYDPCDYLKAQEFQLKRDDSTYKKSQHDDLLNMETGLLGFKGNIHFEFGKPINEKFDNIVHLDKKEIIAAAAQCIDKEIHSNYKIYPCNYIAYDKLNKTERFKGKYTAEDLVQFETYIENQIAKIKLENKDIEFLHRKLMEMYSNTLKNHLIATGSI